MEARAFEAYVHILIITAVQSDIISKSKAPFGQVLPKSFLSVGLLDDMAAGDAGLACSVRIPAFSTSEVEYLRLFTDDLTYLADNDYNVWTRMPVKSGEWLCYSSII